jgi:hypothetical protein
VAITAAAIRYRQLTVSEKLIALLLLLGVLTEGLSNIFEHFKSAVNAHHTVFSIIEVVIPVCIFYALYDRITIGKAVIILLLWGGLVLSLNAVLDDGVKQKNYPLLIQSLVLTLLSCIAFFRLLTHAEMRPWKQISFWYWCTLLISSSYSVLHWGILAIIKKAYPVLQRNLQTGYAILAFLLTAILAGAFILLPSSQKKN